MKPFAKTFFFLVALCTVIFLTAFSIPACSKKQPESKEIKIGVILPLTGDLAEPGTKAFDGIKLAIDNYNETIPDKPIKLIAEDSRANPKDGVNAINKLISVNHVKLIIGDITSGVTLAIAPIAEKNRVVILAPGASNPKVRDAGDYIFRNWASDNFDGDVMAKYLINKLGLKNAAIIYVNNEYGTGLAKAFEKTFEENGGRISLKENYDEGVSDFRTLISKVKSINCDCIYLPGQPKENALLIRQMKELGYNSTVTANLSVETPDFYAIAKELGEGIIFSTPAFDLNSNGLIVKKFVELYESKFKKKPDATAGHGYDAANIMILAIKIADYDTNKVKDQLYKIKNFPGVTGNTTFDDHGDVVKPVMIKKLNKDGTAVIMEIYQP